MSIGPSSAPQSESVGAAEAAAPRVGNGPRGHALAEGYPPPPSTAACAELVPCRHPGRGCPVGVDIPSVTLAIARRDHQEAFRVVRATNPFASTCGYGCHAPCESACRRRSFGAPVAIGALESHGGAFAMPRLATPTGPCASGFDTRSVAGAIGRAADAALSAPRSGKTVAIVGAGAAGLACAYDLALLGHRSIVFDTRAEPGGLMTNVIPAFRFPIASVRAECAAILAAADIEFRPGIPIDDGLALRTLFDGAADAVFLATGASRPSGVFRDLAQPHADIVDAIDVLAGEVTPLKHTVVAGEGSLAIDAARTLVRRAAVGGTAARPVVEVVLAPSLATMGVAPELLAACARDGIRIHYDWVVKRVHVDPESRLLCSIDFERPDGTAVQVLPCDRLVLAEPRVADTSPFHGQIETTRSGFIATDPQTLRTSMPNVWAGGACAFGHRSIAHAVADGKRAAWEIHAAMTGTRVTMAFASAWVEPSSNGHREPLATQRRRALPLLDPPTGDPFAPTTPRADERAASEAARCFDCARVPVVTGECSSCGRCIDVCPTGALSLVDTRLSLNNDLCHRCGACIEACPDGALTMLRAECDERIVFVSAEAPTPHHPRSEPPIAIQEL